MLFELSPYGVRGSDPRQRVHNQPALQAHMLEMPLKGYLAPSKEHIEERPSLWLAQDGECITPRKRTVTDMLGITPSMGRMQGTVCSLVLNLNPPSLNWGYHSR